MDPTIRAALEENVPQARQYALLAADALEFTGRPLSRIPDDEMLREVDHAARCVRGVAQLLALGIAGDAVPDPDAPRPSAAKAADDSFVELLRRFPLKALETTKDVAAARRVRDSLIAREPLGSAATVYVAALCKLLVAYDDGYRPGRRSQPFTSSRSKR